LNNGLQTDVVLLDLTKALDKVPHDVLCSKLYNCGSTLGWIQHFLKHKTQQVLVDGYTSTPSIVTSAWGSSRYRAGPTIVFMLHQRYLSKYQIMCEANMLTTS